MLYRSICRPYGAWLASFTLIVMLVVFTATAFADDPYLGLRVFLKDDAKPVFRNAPVDRNLIPLPVTVEHAEGEWLWIGQAWVKKDQVLLPEAALEYYSQQIETRPTSAAWNNRGSVWKEKGELESAIRDYTEAIRLDPKNAIAFNNRGQAWKKLGEYARAISEYTESIRLAPKSPTAYNNLAWLLATCPDHHIRNGQRAIELATHSCELTGWKHASMLDTLAAAAAEAGQFEKAVEWQQKAIALARSESEKAGLRERLVRYEAKEAFREEEVRR